MNKKNGLTVRDIGKTRRLLLSFHFCMLRQEWLRLIQLFCFNLFSSISLFQEELIFFCSPWWDICTRNWAEWCVFSSEQALLFGQVKRVSREHASERRSREGLRSRVLARLALLAQIGELARRLCFRRKLLTTPGGPSRLRRSLARSRETRFTCPNRRACSQAMFLEENCWQHRGGHFQSPKGKKVQCPGGHPWNWLNH